MNIKILKTLKALECKLATPENATLADLHYAYDYATKLRSQLLGVIYEKEHGFTKAFEEIPNLSELLTEGDFSDFTIMLIIQEPLPPIKELTGAVQEHWVELIQTAIGKAAKRRKLPCFQKAFVWIEVITPKYTDNAKLWDTSNRAINLIINNLKGVFFRDDNHEHIAFGVAGKWGTKGSTIVYILPFDRIEQIINRCIKGTP